MDQSFSDEFVQDERRSLSKLQETILFGAARYWIWIVGATLAGAAIGLYLGASKPNIYMSSAKLHLRFGAREDMTEESLAGIASQRESRPTMEDEIHMLTDRDVFESAIREITPAVFLQPEDPTRYDDPETTPLPVQWMHKLQKYLIQSSGAADVLEGFDDEDQVQLATEILIRDTVVFPNTGSNVITVLHTSTSPEKAQKITAHLVDAFLSRHRRQFSLERYIPSQEEAVEEARATYLKAKQSLDRYHSEKGFSDLDLEITNGFDSLSEISQAKITASSDLGSKRAELATLNELLGSAKADKLASETLQESMAKEITLSAEVAGLEEQNDGLQRADKELRERLKELTAFAPELRTLTDEFEASRTSYEKKREILDELTSLQNIDNSNLSVITLPTLPIEKQGPKRIKLLILGVAAGFAMGGLFAVLRQAFDKSLRYPSTVQRWSGVQLLAVIPESPDVRRLQRVRHFI